MVSGLKRRHLVAGVGASLLCGFARGEGTQDSAWTAACAAIETEIGGRVGIAALDTGSGKRLAYRGDERFALCSTFKWLLVAAVLARVEQGGAVA
jgi:beta-lactamase class A